MVILGLSWPLVFMSIKATNVGFSKFLFVAYVITEILDHGWIEIASK